MIPGNPGLIEYYRDFLDHLGKNLASGSSNVQYVLGGRSLGGFELTAPISQPKDATFNTPPFNLQQQVSFVEAQVNAEAKRLRNEQSNAHAAIAPLRIILIGHSIGAYILLEIIARRQAQQHLNHSSPTDAVFEIAGGICLFPTIVDIAKSPSGRKVSVSLPAYLSSLRLAGSQQLTVHPATCESPWYSKHRPQHCQNPLLPPTQQHSAVARANCDRYAIERCRRHSRLSAK